MADEEQVRALEDRRYDALVAGDWDAFAACCHPDLSYTHSSGEVDTRDTYVDKLREGWYAYHSIEHPVDRVVVNGDVAMVFGQMRADITAGGVEKRLDNECLSVWVRDDSGWLFYAYAPTVIKR